MQMEMDRECFISSSMRFHIVDIHHYHHFLELWISAKFLVNDCQRLYESASCVTASPSPSVGALRKQTFAYILVSLHDRDALLSTRSEISSSPPSFLFTEAFPMFVMTLIRLQLVCPWGAFSAGSWGGTSSPFSALRVAKERPEDTGYPTHSGGFSLDLYTLQKTVLGEGWALSTHAISRKIKILQEKKGAMRWSSEIEVRWV